MSNSTQLRRRQFLRRTASFTALTLGVALRLPRSSAAASDNATAKPIPVILATDIGDDIDDTWALGLLLKCPELDLKLAVTDFGKGPYRAKLLAKFLQVTGHSRIPVGVGPEGEPHGEGGQAEWIKGYDLQAYPGKVFPDGIQALIDTIMSAPEPVTLIGIGPMPNIAAALKREPRIATRARFVGMDGSVRVGYGGNAAISPEWNIKASVQAAQQVLSAPWDITITPLDTCGLVTLDGERYRRLLDSKDPIASAVIQNYRLWSKADNNKNDAEQRSSTLFDTVAVYLAFTQNLCKMERLNIRVSGDGYTVIDPAGKLMNVATEWKSLAGYRDFLVNRLCGRT